MPLIGWDIDGRVWTPPEIAAAAERGEILGGRWPAAVLLRMTEEPTDWRVLRSSALGGCQRQRVLAHYEDFVLRPDERWAAIVGTGIHSVLADQRDDPNVLVEQRLTVPLEVDGEELLLSGQVDHYHRPSGTLTDYKSTGSVWQKEKLSWGYEVQQNVYAELLRAHGEQPRHARLWFVELRPVKGTVRTKVVPVPLWESRRIRGLVEKTGRALVAAHRDGRLPPAFGPDHPLAWMCKTCHVAAVCRELERDEKGSQE